MAPLICTVPGCGRPRHVSRSGKAHTTHCFAHYQAAQARYRAEPTRAGMTEEERVVMNCAFEGLSYAEIADKTGLSGKVVAMRIRSILRKRGIKTLLQLLAQEIKRLKEIDE